MKREITKEDIGKMFRVVFKTEPHSRIYEIVCDVDDDCYWYYGYSYHDRTWGRVHNSGRGPYGSYSFEEVNTLTAIVLFGSNIPKEFKGYEEVKGS